MPRDKAGTGADHCDRHQRRARLSARTAQPLKRNQKLTRVIQAAVAKGLLPDFTENAASCDLYDLDAFDARLQELTSAFPEDFFDHAVAVKANPTSHLLSRVVAHGIGLECASVGEVHHALSLGAETVIFDSPCKSKSALQFTLFENDNVHVNLDNEAEIATVNELIREAEGEFDIAGRIGLRINPNVGSGAIASTSTADRGSKFGLPLLDETRERLIGIFVDNADWLHGVHIHVGSQVPLELLAAGVDTLMEFVAVLEERGVKLRFIDIGGGIGTSYTEDGEPHSFAKYRSVLEQRVPRLFSGEYRVATEFGRCVFTKPGKTLTRVAAIKGAPWHPGTPIAVAHVGANQFPREAYHPDSWRHRFEAFTSTGGVHADANADECDSLACAGGGGEAGAGANSKSGMRTFDVAGPLCFQGDYLVKGVALPAALKGNDIICIHDTGAYCMSMYSKYNSVQSSAVYGYRRCGKTCGRYEFVLMKERESLAETVAFWGPAEARKVTRSRGSSLSAAKSQRQAGA